MGYGGGGGGWKGCVSVVRSFGSCKTCGKVPCLCIANRHIQSVLEAYDRLSSAL